MKLSDNSIMHIAKLVQMAILTGTDVIDHLRMMELNQSGELLELDEEYQQVFDDSLAKMLKNAETKTVD